MFDVTLQRVARGEHLSLDEMSAAIDVIMDGQLADEQIAAFLLALREKGETVPEVAGAATSLRKHMTPIRSRRTGLIDTCGTGGDGSRTFNISTAAALVTAAAGVPVAKHGNRGITSRTGSADALAALGVNVDADVPCVTNCLDEIGICFCFAPLLHPSMKRVAQVRKQLGVPTIFNILGPLSNPAAAPFQLLGVGKPHLRNIMAEALSLLGSQRAAVVCGEDGLDEVTLAGSTHVALAEGGKVLQLEWTPGDFGLEPSGREELLVDGPAQSAAVIQGILAGKQGPARDIVVANSAAALWTARKSEDLRRCAELVSTAIDTGAAANLLDRLKEQTQSRS